MYFIISLTAVYSLGNVLTSIRECQALMSLRSLNKALQDVIIGDRDEGGVVSSSSSSSSSSSTAINNLEPLQCPSSLPLALWAALEKEYNSSQLRAIHAVCFTHSPSPPSSSSANLSNRKGSISSAEALNNPVTLLQGPPGTGKTRTILAIVAALLAGGGNEKRVGTKVQYSSSSFFMLPWMRIKFLHRN
jgi:hypothetical protein